MTTMELIEKYGIGFNCLSDAYDLGVKHGRADAFAECIKLKEEDEIYLLSIDEYDRYKKKIPKIPVWWWLRSPSRNSILAMGVYSDGSILEIGYRVDDVCGVRPVLKFTNLKSEISESSKGKDYFIFNRARWKIIDEENEIAIAELLIEFEKFDDNSNDYKHSYIRQWLLNWIAD